MAWSPLELHLHLAVLHVRASIWRNVSEHNEQAGQGAVSPRHRRLTQTHQRHSSSRTARKKGRGDKRLREGAGVSDWETPQQHISHNCEPYCLCCHGNGGLSGILKGGTVQKNLQLSLTLGETEMEPVYERIAARLMHRPASRVRS